MGRKVFETTDEQFEIFVEAVGYWKEYFGILDADINVTHEDIEIDSAEGCCSGNASNRVFTICLNKVINDGGVGNYLTDDGIKEIAAHEVLEVFFYPIRGLALDRNGDWDQIDTEIHRLIRTLENVLLKPIIQEQGECCGCENTSIDDLTMDETIDEIEAMESTLDGVNERLSVLNVHLEVLIQEEENKKDNDECDYECDECDDQDCKCRDCPDEGEACSTCGTTTVTGVDYKQDIADAVAMAIRTLKKEGLLKD